MQLRILLTHFLLQIFCCYAAFKANSQIPAGAGIYLCRLLLWYRRMSALALNTFAGENKPTGLKFVILTFQLHNDTIPQPPA
jgi:hypothetical protein